MSRISPHQTLAIALRLFALWLGVYILRALATLLIGKPIDEERIWVGIGIALVGAIIVLALWLFPRTMAGTLLSRPVAEREPDGPTGLVSCDGLRAIGFVDAEFRPSGVHSGCAGHP